MTVMAGIELPVDVPSFTALRPILCDLADVHDGCHWFYVSARASTADARAAVRYLDLFARGHASRLIATFEVPTEHGHCWVFDATAASHAYAMEAIARTKCPGALEIASGYRPAVL